MLESNFGITKRYSMTWSKIEFLVLRTFVLLAGFFYVLILCVATLRRILHFAKVRKEFIHFHLDVALPTIADLGSVLVVGRWKFGPFSCRCQR